MSNYVDWGQVLAGGINRARWVERYAGVFHVHRENVAEHSYYVALYTYLLYMEVCENYEVNADPHTLQEALVKALLHDVEECATGDVIREVKHGFPSLQESLKHAGKLLWRSMAESLVARQSDYCELEEELVYRWEKAKNNSPSGLIVRLADLLSVVSYAIIEVRSGSNYGHRIIIGVCEHLNTELEEYRRLAKSSTVDTEFYRVATTMANVTEQVVAEVKEWVDADYIS